MFSISFKVERFSILMKRIGWDSRVTWGLRNSSRRLTLMIGSFGVSLGISGMTRMLLLSSSFRVSASRSAVSWSDAAWLKRSSQSW
ncbi:hypothetical protein D3C81_2064920 [compost metagenome]